MTRAREWSSPTAKHLRSRCEAITTPAHKPSPATPPLRAHRHLCACQNHHSCGHNLSPNALISRHAATVRSLAASLARKQLPLNQDELAQCGHIALLELSRRAQPVNDALIWQRIRGSMLDACRREGWYGRRTQNDTPRRQVRLLEPADLDLRTDPEEATPQDAQRLRATLLDALATLPDLDQAILLQHDLDQIPLRELARTMRRAPSRLSHRRTDALSSLRRTLEARGIRSSSDLI